MPEPTSNRLRIALQILQDSCSLSPEFKSSRDNAIPGAGLTRAVSPGKKCAQLFVSNHDHFVKPFLWLVCTSRHGMCLPRLKITNTASPFSHVNTPSNFRAEIGNPFMRARLASVFRASTTTAMYLGTSPHRRLPAEFPPPIPKGTPRLLSKHP
jgi:hypothetical protein